MKLKTLQKVIDLCLTVVFLTLGGLMIWVGVEVNKPLIATYGLFVMIIPIVIKGVFNK